MFPKLRVIFIFLSLGISVMNAQSSFLLSDINEIITQIKLKYAPDSRTALFNIAVTEENGTFIHNGETNLSEAKGALLNEMKMKKINISENINLLPEKKLGDKIYGIINLSVANIRKEPKHPAELVTQALLGTPVSVLKVTKDGWYLIQTPDKYLGWVDDDGVHLVSKEESDNYKKSQRVIITKIYEHCFSKADENSQIISDLVQGNILKLIGEENNYFKVELPDNRHAYVNKSSALNIDDWLNKINLTGESVLEYAHKFMGVPYLWGGTSSKGFDCSGFTKTVYFMHGIILPRDASQQVFTGIEIDTKDGFGNLQAGDLLFFGTKATESTKERVTHVGFYISDLDFIHEGGRVKINSFDSKKSNYSKYRHSTFLRAKRIITSTGQNGVELFKDSPYYKQ